MAVDTAPQPGALSPRGHGEKCEVSAGALDHTLTLTRFPPGAPQGGLKLAHDPLLVTRARPLSQQSRFELPKACIAFSNHGERRKTA